MIGAYVANNPSLGTLLDNLAVENKSIEFKAEGPLKELTSICSYSNVAEMLIPHQDNNVTFIDSLDILKYAREVVTYDENTYLAMNHDLVMMKTKELIGTAASQTIALTKNLALPLIEEISETAEEVIQDMAPTRGIALSIAPLTFSSIWHSAHLASITEPYTRQYRDLVDSVNVVKQHPARSAEELSKLVLTGQSSWDSDITSWIDEGGALYLFEAYCTFFSNAHPIDDSIADTVFYGRALTSKDYHIAIILLASALEKKPDSTVRVSSYNFKKHLLGMIHGASSAVKYLKEEYNRAIKSKRMVLEFPKPHMESRVDKASEAVILVIPAIYDYWIEQGGTPDALMGEYITSRNTNLDQIAANVENSCKAWNYRATMLIRDSVHLQDAEVKSVISKVITKTINAAEDDVYKRYTKESMHRALAMYLKRETDFSPECLYDTITKIVCRVLFAGTNVYSFIKEMQAVADQNDDLSPREVSTLALCEVMATWAVDNLTVTQL